MSNAAGLFSFQQSKRVVVLQLSHIRTTPCENSVLPVVDFTVLFVSPCQLVQMAECRTANDIRNETSLQK